MKKIKIKISIPKLVFILSVVALLLVGIMTLVAIKTLIPKKEEDSRNITIPYEEISGVDIESVNINDSFYTNLKIDENHKKGELYPLAVVEVKYEVYNKDGINDDLIALLKEREVVVRSIILGIIRKETKDDMNKEGQKEILGERILKELQREFETNAIVKVYVLSIVTD